MGPVYTSMPYSGSLPSSRDLKKSTFKRMEMLESSSSMFSKMRV
mgnify:CR=1 FL=1